MSGILVNMPWWVALIGTTVALLVVAEIGFRLGRRQRDQPGDRGGLVSVHSAAILGLLGLLLAFSFSIVEARLAARKALVLQEANAIGTAYLRAKMLPAPHGERIQRQLYEYVRLRTNLRTQEEIARVIAESDVLHAEMWAEATAVARAHPTSEIVGLFVASLNDVIDLHTSRQTVALHQRMPRAILDILLVVSVLATSIVGFGAGLAGWRSSVPTFALVLAIAAVTMMIMELDVPGNRMFRVNQWAIENVFESMSKDMAGPVSTAPPR